MYWKKKRIGDRFCKSHTLLGLLEESDAGLF